MNKKRIPTMVGEGSLRLESSGGLDLTCIVRAKLLNGESKILQDGEERTEYSIQTE